VCVSLFIFIQNRFNIYTIFVSQYIAINNRKIIKFRKYFQYISDEFILLITKRNLMQIYKSFLRILFFSRIRIFSLAHAYTRMQKKYNSFWLWFLFLMLTQKIKDKAENTKRYFSLKIDFNPAVKLSFFCLIWIGFAQVLNDRESSIKHALKFFF
jgi:hypothetical protein